MKLLTVFGTRPECIKLAPVIKSAQSANIEISTCVTGQHREMLTQCLDIFDVVPDYNLDVMLPDQTLAGLTGRILDRIAPVLDNSKPDFVLVQGDTTTAFAAALAAFYAKIPVAHIEAGLRTYDLASPFPEEGMRQMITRLTSWHFAPTGKNRQALIAEGVDQERICLSGNTVIDALFMIRDRIKRGVRDSDLELPPKLFEILSKPGQRMVLITGHRRESFGSGIQDICNAIAKLAGDFTNTTFIYPVHLNPNVLDPVHRLLGNRANVFLLKPLDYYTFVYLMARAHLIISDSGGVQEEAPSLKVPVLVTRNVTERMEVVHSGNVKLVGSDPQRIIQEASLLLTDDATRSRMVLPANPYGDGHSSQRILQTLTTGVPAHLNAEKALVP